MNALRRFQNEIDPLAQMEILIDTFGIDGVKRNFGINDLTEDYVETLDVYSAYDFLEMYEAFIIDKWSKLNNK